MCPNGDAATAIDPAPPGSPQLASAGTTGQRPPALRRAVTQQARKVSACGRDRHTDPERWRRNAARLA